MVAEWLNTLPPPPHLSDWSSNPDPTSNGKAGKLLAVGQQFTVQNLDTNYISLLVSFAHNNTRCDVTYTVC